MSLADFTARARMASSTLIWSPALMPSLVGGCDAALAETVIRSVPRTRPSEIASKARYRVMTLVIDAGYRGLSARLAYRTSPVLASTTIAAYFVSAAGVGLRDR